MSQIYKPTTYVSGIFYLVFTSFFIVLLMSIYGLIAAIIDEIQWSMQLSLPLWDIVMSMVILISIGSIVIMSIIGGLLLMLTLNVSIHIRDHDFRVMTFMYKSDWLTWDEIKKVRNIPFYGEHRIMQVGINGIGRAFKLYGFFSWMYPYGAINIGSGSIQNGDELLKIFKRKRPDLF